MLGFGVAASPDDADANGRLCHNGVPSIMVLNRKNKIETSMGQRLA
jgi:hypothetical protein